MIDTHAHLDDDRFSSDLPAVLQRAASAGIERIITIGVDAPTSQSAVTLAERYPILRAAVGLQPNHVAEAQPGDWEKVVALAAHPLCVAIGETGLDRYWDSAPFALQEEHFARHLQLARETNKPVIIHCREAELDVVRMLTAEHAAHGPIRGVLHSYTGNADSARHCIEMGLFVSFAGMITYKTADAVRATAATVPLDRLLIETDSPYLAPVPHRGKRNEPAYVAHTAAALAQVHQIDVATLITRTTANARELFGLN